jgi:hypothetical protein
MNDGRVTVEADGTVTMCIRWWPEPQWLLVLDEDRARQIDAINHDPGDEDRS